MPLARNRVYQVASRATHADSTGLFTLFPLLATPNPPHHTSQSSWCFGEGPRAPTEPKPCPRPAMCRRALLVACVAAAAARKPEAEPSGSYDDFMASMKELGAF